MRRFNTDSFCEASFRSTTPSGDSWSKSTNRFVSIPSEVSPRPSVERFLPVAEAAETGVASATVSELRAEVFCVVVVSVVVVVRLLVFCR